VAQRGGDHLDVGRSSHQGQGRGRPGGGVVGGGGSVREGNGERKEGRAKGKEAAFRCGGVVGACGAARRCRRCGPRRAFVERASPAGMGVVPPPTAIYC
jgi:hypothetical protein